VCWTVCGLYRLRSDTAVAPGHAATSLLQGLTDFSNATRRALPNPSGVMAHKMHQSPNSWHVKTWHELQGRLNQQRALGLLWNHYNEEHIRLIGGRAPNRSDWGEHTAGVFASEEYLRCVSSPRAKL
jgi:hypothetical protein